MLIMINGDNKKRGKAWKCKNSCVRIVVKSVRIVLDLHGVIIDSRMVVPFEYE